jgi:hypothetical protein
VVIAVLWHELVLGLAWWLQPVTAVAGGIRAFRALRSKPVDWRGVRTALGRVWGLPVAVIIIWLAINALLDLGSRSLIEELVHSFPFYCSAGVTVLIVAGVIFHLPAKR